MVLFVGNAESQCLADKIQRRNLAACPQKDKFTCRVMSFPVSNGQITNERQSGGGRWGKVLRLVKVLAPETKIKDRSI